VPHKRVPSSHEDPVHLHLRDIGRRALLSQDGEVRLAEAAEAGRQARSELAANTDRPLARKRQLRRVAAEGDAAVETFVNGNPASWCRSPRSTRPPTCRCSTWCGMATSGSSTL